MIPFFLLIAAWTALALIHRNPKQELGQYGSPSPQYRVGDDTTLYLDIATKVVKEKNDYLK